MNQLAINNLTPLMASHIATQPGLGLKPISREYIRKHLPAIYGRQAAGMSQVYTYIKTGALIDALADEGWIVTSAFQPKPQKRDPATVQHVVKLHQSKDIDRLLSGDWAECPVMILHNSGNGRSKLRASFGVYRWACSNGIVVGKTLRAIAMIHQGLSRAGVAALIQEFATGSAEVSAMMDRMRSIVLNEQQRTALAREAVALRTGRTLEEAERDFDLAGVLTPVRVADSGHDLWTTFNVLQERVMHGALPLRTGGRGRAVAPVRDTLGGHAMNEQLWGLAERMAA
jgi:hypothetical protein